MRRDRDGLVNRKFLKGAEISMLSGTITFSKDKIFRRQMCGLKSNAIYSTLETPRLT